MSCNYSPNFEIALNVTFSVFEAIIEICPATYLRPDPGGSMMPWLLTLLLLFFHLPTCFLRAVKWESAQYLALGLAIFNIALTVQAYISTQLRAEEVLVWMPLTVLLDVGATLQMVVLIIEMHRHGDTRQRGLSVLCEALGQGFTDLRKSIARNLLQKQKPKVEADSEGVQVQEQPHQDRHDSQQDPSQVVDRNPQDQPVEPLVAASVPQNQVNAPAGIAAPGAVNEAGVEAGRQPDHSNCEALHYAIVALVAFILCIMLVTLQTMGLYYAVQGRRKPDIMVKWCSPAFRDFALAVTTGDCKKYEVFESSSNGIGCISLPAEQQRSWLLGAIISLSVALICQTADVVLMMCTNSETKWRGVKAQRPWFTMIGGVIMLGVMIIFGVFNADHLPKGVTETVWIYRKEASRAMGRVCKGSLNPPGLRGVMIGYMDGLFGSWGGIYSGRN